MNNIPLSSLDIGRIETYMINLKPIKRTLRNAGFVLDDFALLLHDCVVFYNQQDPKHLSDIVQKETGFTLQFSEELY